MRPESITTAFLVAAFLPIAAAAQDAPTVAPFSAAKAGRTAAPWDTVKINERKKLTSYELVDDGGTTVLHASADNAASMLGVPLNADVRKTPVLEWRWRVSALIEDADNSVAAKEDSPARVILEFDGDKSKLGFGDRTAARLASNLSGRELPYATLMYVWANAAPVGTVIPNPHTKRVQMIVVSSGAAGVGKWQSLKRNVVDDYKRAFNEEPGALKSVGVLTDTDNTGTKVEA
ncbi:MAG: DUF3047 domain-containing protein, partial [Betaproteobacteria bacterium]